MTWPFYTKACRDDVNELLKRGGSLSAYRANKDYGAGPKEGSWAWRLERDIERRFNVKHAIVVNSGTAGLHAGLHSLGLRRGDEVVTSPYTFSATASAILLAGGIPVFADVDPYTYCITKETVKHAITKKTRAILPVHLFGGLADTDGLSGFGLPVVEDACQAVGAQRGGTLSGTFGISGAYSFNGSKNIPAGECGTLVTNSNTIAEKARLFSNHGENFQKEEVGYNYRPNEVTACIAWHGLQDLESRNQRRIDLVKRLQHNLKDITRSVNPVDGSHVYYVYPFRLNRFTNRPRFLNAMKRRGMNCSGGYVTPPIHHYEAFKKYATRPLPVVDELSFHRLCLIGDLTPDKPLSYADKVAQAIRESICGS